MHSKTSPLLATLAERPSRHSPLPDLQSVVLSSAAGSPTFVFNHRYPVYLLNSMAVLLNSIAMAKRPKLHATLSQHFMLAKPMADYLRAIAAAKPLNKAMVGHWFAQVELTFLAHLLQSTDWPACQELKARIGFAVAVRLTEHQRSHLLALFERVLFNVESYANTCGLQAVLLERWRDIYQMQFLMDLWPQKTGITIANFDRIILPASWPYELLAIVFRADPNRYAVPPSGMHYDEV